MADEFAAFEGALRTGEELLSCTPIDGFFASEHPIAGSAVYVGLTTDRYIVYTAGGVLQKRYEEAASWQLSVFTSRLNSNEGAALGPFLYLLTLFTDRGETVSAGFRSAAARDRFKRAVTDAYT